MEKAYSWSFARLERGFIALNDQTRPNYFMKTMLFVMTFVTVTSSFGQNATSTAQSRPAGTISPVAPGLPGSPINPGLPGFNNQNPILSSSTFPTGQGGTNLINQFGTNISTADLTGALALLQGAIQQALPVVAAFNNNFQFSELNNSGVTNGTANVSTAIANTAAGRSTTGTTGSLLSQNLGVNAGQNLSGLSGVAAAPAVATPQGASPNPSGRINPTFGTGTGAANSFGVSVLGTNNFPANNATANSARALIVLQSDLERSLQLVAALNGGGFGISNGVATPNQFTSFGTNNFGSRALTPTGR
jgi:hypothetical protein